MQTELVISVSELVRRLRRAVEGIHGHSFVEGEVGALKRASSGHLYFTLKDEREPACLECVMYRLNALRAMRYLVDGARVQVRGRPTLWGPRGRLQLAVEAVRPVGRGALLEALEQLKQRLAAEGLFEAKRKRPIPPDPRVVGVVTSAHGAALHDIRTVAFRRGFVRIVVSPALVQGEGAPASIVRAIDLIERYPGLDVLVVGRGGGSEQDLHCFNDERVVRRVAAVQVPTVSAVGHEIDTTLTDLVADVRAATPSQAAELVVPDARAKAEALHRVRRGLGRAVGVRLAEDRATLDRLVHRLGDPRFALAERRQELDDLCARLERFGHRLAGRRRTELDMQFRRLLARHPRSVVVQAQLELTPLRERLAARARLRLHAARGRLGGAVGRLDALSPLAALSRGYAIVRDPGGALVRRADAVEAGQTLEIRLHRGRLSATVTGVDMEPMDQASSGAEEDERRRVATKTAR